MSSLTENIEEPLAAIRRGYVAGRMGHAYIIHGEPRGNARELALGILRLLMCENTPEACGSCSSCKRVSDLSHPDCHWVEPQKKSRVIGVDDVRGLLHSVYQSAFEGGWKAVVIAAADRMNPQAANAFLKTLEEPPAQTILFLLTNSPTSLLPTIVSRCQTIKLPLSFC